MFAYLLTFRQLSFHEGDTFNLMELLNRSSLLEEYSLVDNVLFEYMLHHKEELLVIMDGYDEYSKRDEIVNQSEEKYPNDPRNRMPVSAMCSKLIKGKIMRESVVLVTSRPAESDELGQVNFDEYVEITGFSSKQVREYIEKYFQVDEAVKNIIQEHIMGNENLVSFAHIPVLCFLMCWYMEWQIQSNSHSRTLPVTVTDLCVEVIQVFVQRHHSELKGRHLRLEDRRRASAELLGSTLLQKFQRRRHSNIQQSTEEESVSPFQEKVLDKISKLAAKLLIEKKLSFSIEDMESFGLTREEIENLKASGLLQCGPTLRISPFEVAHNFSFTHLILHEYLAALWFVKERRMPTKDMATGMVCQFMAGALSLEKNRKLLEKLVDWIKIHPSLRKDQKLLLTAKCLYEFKDKEFAKIIVANQYQRYCDDGNILFLSITDVDCVLVSFLLDIFSSLNEIQAGKNKKTLQALLRKKPSSTLKTLYIGMSTLTLSGFQRICNSLNNEFCSVTEMETFDCGLRDDCGPCLGELLVKSNLAYLSMNENKLTDKTAAILCHSLKDQRCQLTRLYLSYNEISDVGSELLCKTLLDPCCKLTRLVMYKNNVTDECQKSLKSLIEKHKPGFDLRF
uniref:Nucleotide-binding and leucine-rich repeat receptor n=1 Tax=Actinia tenebrosa TaxID=6105 RepID=A0A1D8RAC6_ACTTE|nr:nucleotide-binding and leucine-rich repeat receptor [Actinia tenebrosa]